jgi:hypothetical protein
MRKINANTALTFFSDNDTIKTKGQTMKNTLTLVTLLSSLTLFSFADEIATAPQMTPEQAKTQWQSMSPEQQAAMTYGKAQAQEKQASWQALTPEQQQAKMIIAKTTAQPYATQAQSQMQTMQPQMQNRMQTMSGRIGRGR